MTAPEPYTTHAPDEPWSAARYDAMLARVAARLSPDWQPRAYHAHRTHDGTAYTFRLYRGRRPVAEVEDAGNGGGPAIYWTDRPASDDWHNEIAGILPADALAGETAIEAILRRAGR